LFFAPGPFQPAPERSAAYNRGAYLVTALAHCGECHTSRNFLGAVRSGHRLAGTRDGPDGQLVPNITPDPNTGIGKWEKGDVVELLRSGTTPEQGKVKGAMRETNRRRSQISERRRPRGDCRLPLRPTPDRSRGGAEALTCSYILVYSWRNGMIGALALRFSALASFAYQTSIKLPN
jgi:hypothetical protein